MAPVSHLCVSKSLALSYPHSLAWKDTLNELEFEMFSLSDDAGTINFSFVNALFIRKTCLDSTINYLPT